MTETGVGQHFISAAGIAESKGREIATIAGTLSARHPRQAGFTGAPAWGYRKRDGK
jgi:hypothetical protein